MKDVAIVIINYNSAKFTIEAINSIIEKVSHTIDFEIVVVDNNSKKENFNYLKQNFPAKENIKLQRSIINTGFGGGNMFGAQFVNAKYTLFLNNDTLFKNDCLSILFEYMEENKECGVVTAQNYDENGNFVPSFDHFKGIRKLIFGRSLLQKMDPVKFPKKREIYKKPLEVNYVNGAFMLFRTEVFAKVGGFDTSIFLYFEETDICYRILKQGYKSVLHPSAKITHYLGVSTGTSDAVSNESLLSYLYVLKKNYSFFKYSFIRLYLIITFTVKPKKWFHYKVLLFGSNPKKSLRVNQSINF